MVLPRCCFQAFNKFCCVEGEKGCVTLVWMRCMHAQNKISNRYDVDAKDDPNLSTSAHNHTRRCARPRSTSWTARRSSIMFSAHSSSRPMTTLVSDWRVHGTHGAGIKSANASCLHGCCWLNHCLSFPPSIPLSLFTPLRCRQ